MRKIKQPMTEEVTCDITGEVQGYADFGSVYLPILVADKDEFKEIGDDSYIPEYLTLDVNPEITLQIVKYLIKKYPILKSKFRYLNNAKLISTGD